MIWSRNLMSKRPLRTTIKRKAFTLYSHEGCLPCLYFYDFIFMRLLTDATCCVYFNGYRRLAPNNGDARWRYRYQGSMPVVVSTASWGYTRGLLAYDPDNLRIFLHWLNIWPHFKLLQHCICAWVFLAKVIHYTMSTMHAVYADWYQLPSAPVPTPLLLLHLRPADRQRH